MIKRKGQPITGARPAMRPTPNVLSDAAKTSRDAQRLVRQTAQPFQSRNGVVNIPAPTHPAFRVNSNFAKATLTGATGRPVSIRNRPTVNLAAVGEPRLPKGYNSINSGFPQTGAQRVIGGGNQASAKENARLRKEYPGIFGRGYRP